MMLTLAGRHPGKTPAPHYVHVIHTALAGHIWQPVFGVCVVIVILLVISAPFRHKRQQQPPRRRRSSAGSFGYAAPSARRGSRGGR
jgi:hypothetical protein